MPNKPNYKQIFAKQKQYEDIVKKACPSIDNKSGVYFYTRTDLVTGEKFAYIGLAKRLLARCCQHMLGYQHIDISIRKRGLYSKENEGGWKLNCLHFPEHLIEEKERFYIEQYQKANVTLLNIEGGGRQGKVDIAERKPTKTYTDGLKQGRKNAVREVKVFFDKYLDYSIKDNPTKIKERKYNEFKEWLNDGNEETSTVIIDGQEYSLYDYSYSMDKEYVKEPTRNTSEPFQNLAPFEFDKDGE